MAERYRQVTCPACFATEPDCDSCNGRGYFLQPVPPISEAKRKRIETLKAETRALKQQAGICDKCGCDHCSGCDYDHDCFNEQ